MAILQSVLEKCWKKESLLSELYLQLLKQTTEHPEPNSRVNQKHWAGLALLCSLLPPSNPGLRKYLFSHLKKCGTDSVTEEGRYARFAEKVHLQITSLFLKHIHSRSNPANLNIFSVSNKPFQMGRDDNGLRQSRRSFAL